MGCESLPVDKRLTVQACLWRTAWLLGGLLLAGCASLRVPDAPTMVPTEFLPTMIAMTIESRLTEESTPPANSVEVTPQPVKISTSTTAPIRPTPSATLEPLDPTQTSAPRASPSPTPGRSTRTPTLTPTRSIPEAAIQIRQPGPLSKVISPFVASGSLDPGSEGRVRLELLGEDGRLLLRKLLNYRTDLGRLGLSEKVDFEISAVAETGRLQISTYDQFGRMIAFSSVDLILLSLGEADINPPGLLTEPIVIYEPLPNKLIQGGKVFISGFTRLSSDQPLLIELIAANGGIVGYRQAGVTLDSAGGYTPFEVEVPYQVSEPTWVRLTVKEMSSDKIEGLVQLTSLEVLLSP
jgi:hypothetical protein